MEAYYNDKCLESSSIGTPTERLIHGLLVNGADEDAILTQLDAMTTSNAASNAASTGASTEASTATPTQEKVIKFCTKIDDGISGNLIHMGVFNLVFFFCTSDDKKMICTFWEVTAKSFLVACTRLYKPLCLSVGRLVGWLVGPSHFTFFMIF